MPEAAKYDLIGRISIGAITLFILVVFNVPWFPEFFKYGIDSSWLFALHKATAEQWKFGVDIVWHYGPLGFLYGKFYYPDTYDCMLIGWVLFSAIFFIGAYSIIINSHKHPNFIALPIIAVIVSMSYDSLFLLLPIIFFIHSIFIKTKASTAINLLLIIACAAAVLVKISYGLLALGLIFLVDMYILIHKRKLPLFLFIWVILIFALWMAVGQQLADIIPFIKGALEHGKGFATTGGEMSLYVLYSVLLYALGAIVFTSIAGAIFWKKQCAQAIVFIFAMLGTTVICIKVGFLNSNHMHIFEAVAVLVVMMLLWRDLFFESMSVLQKNTLVLYCMSVAVFAVFGMVNEEKKLTIEKLVSQNLSMFAEGGATAERIFTQKRSEHEEALDKIRDNAPIHHIEGTVDLYSCHQVALLAHGLNYLPRPVIQSYHTYTPYLSELNRNHITSGQSADNVLFTINTFMNRYPSIDDGISWPELLTHYDVERVYGDFLYLNKRGVPRSYSIIPRQTIKTSFGSTIEISDEFDGSVVWAQIKIKKTILGHLAKMLFRNAHVNMSFTTASGYKRTNRIIPEIVSEGFVLSPLIDNKLQFTLMAMGDSEGLKDLALKSVEVSVESENWLSELFYEPEVEIILSNLHLEYQDQEISGWNKVSTMAKMTLSPLESEVVSIENVLDQHISYIASDKEQYIKINGASRLYYPLDNGAGSIKAEYGVYNQHYDIKALTNGVGFNIYGVDYDGNEVLVWSGDVAGLSTGDDGIDKEMYVKFKRYNYAGLIFETKPVDLSKSNWSYWGNVRIK